ncbi:MAG TPA: phosphatidylglycerophosphatase A, partial [Geoalkalibacter subterraneus]|nr:phosphatidylglycerophosphatase A [Geoalkalibacter subterraneus]
FLATNGGLGYAPLASGTFGTLAGIPAFYYLSCLSGLLQFVVLVGVITLSIFICQRAGNYFGEADDGRIVIDELAGYLVTVAFLPFTWGTALLAFFWFRLFDILKPPPIGYIDRNFKNGFGVTFDDVLAGVYAALALRLCLALFS